MLIRIYSPFIWYLFLNCLKENHKNDIHYFCLRLKVCDPSPPLTCWDPQVGVWGGDCDVADCYEFSEVSRSSSTTYLCHARRSPLSEHPAWDYAHFPLTDPPHSKADHFHSVSALRFLIHASGWVEQTFVWVAIEGLWMADFLNAFPGDPRG